MVQQIQAGKKHGHSEGSVSLVTLKEEEEGEERVSIVLAEGGREGGGSNLCLPCTINSLIPWTVKDKTSTW